MAGWVREPEVPVKTTLALPACALLPAVRVKLCGVPGVSEADAGLAVTPAGNPLSATLTVPVKPFTAVADSCTGCPAPPTVRLRDWGLRASEKSACAGGGAVTVMASEAVCVSVPEVPVKVAVADPGAVPAAADTLRTVVAAAEPGPGVSVSVDGFTVTPAGKPVMATCTLEENPLIGVAVTETVDATPFATRAKDAGLMLSEKSGGGAEAAWTESEPCALAVWPLTVVVKLIVAAVVAAEEAAVSVTVNATPGVSDSVAGEIVTPVGSPETATVAAPVPAGAVSSREACCAVAPAVKWTLDGEKVRASCGAISPVMVLLPLPPQEERPPANRPLKKTQNAPVKKRLKRQFE